MAASFLAAFTELSSGAYCKACWRLICGVSTAYVPLFLTYAVIAGEIPQHSLLKGIVESLLFSKEGLGEIYKVRIHHVSPVMYCRFDLIYRLNDSIKESRLMRVDAR